MMWSSYRGAMHKAEGECQRCMSSDNPPCMPATRVCEVSEPRHSHQCFDNKTPCFTDRGTSDHHFVLRQGTPLRKNKVYRTTNVDLARLVSPSHMHKKSCPTLTFMHRLAQRQSPKGNCRSTCKTEEDGCFEY